MKKSYLALVLLLGVSAIGGLLAVFIPDTSEGEVRELTVYSGRSEEFIAPFFANWEAESGIKLNVRYGDSAELAAQILEEGKNSPADIFLAQDAGSLGAISAARLLATLPAGVGAQIENIYTAKDRSWIGVTGRARVFAFRTGAVAVLPNSISDLTTAAYKGKVGIAPSNASFQAFVTALVNEKGEAFAQNWLTGMKSNDVEIYLKNSAIVEAIDKGEINLGLVNHYYIWEVSQALGREINVTNGYFSAGDLGNLVNVSGAGVLKSSTKFEAALGLINYLTSKPTQEQFVKETHEYSLIAEVKAPETLPSLQDFGSPSVDLGDLANVQRTQKLLIKVGLL